MTNCMSATTITNDSTLIIANTPIFCDATNQNLVITLPTAVNNNDQYIIKKIDSSMNIVTINTVNNETIEGNITYVLDKQFMTITVVSNGNNWFIINKVTSNGYGN